MTQAPSASRAHPVRCLAAWAGLGAVAWLLGGLVLGDLAAAAGALADGTWRLQPFEELLVWLASAAVVVALTWLWIVAGVVALDAARGRRRESVPGCPAVVRRLVLAACGVAVGSGALGVLAAPALAEGNPAPVPLGIDGPTTSSLAGADDVRRDLDGLPMPDRDPADPRRDAAPDDDPASGSASGSRAGGGGILVVEPGDSLWDIAAADLSRDLGHEAPPGLVDLRWREIHRLNAGVIGVEPDLIHPGQRLRTPPGQSADRTADRTEN